MSVRLRLLALPLSLACVSAAHAASYASRVISYTPGTASPLWQNPSAALGAASLLTGENSAASNYFGFPNILSPFSPASLGRPLRGDSGVTRPRSAPQRGSRSSPDRS